jgi:hypothetical protein
MKSLPGAKSIGSEKVSILELLVEHGLKNLQLQLLDSLKLLPPIPPRRDHEPPVFVAMLSSRKQRRSSSSRLYHWRKPHGLSAIGTVYQFVPHPLYHTAPTPEDGRDVTRPLASSKRPFSKRRRLSRRFPQPERIDPTPPDAGDLRSAMKRSLNAKSFRKEAPRIRTRSTSVPWLSSWTGIRLAAIAKSRKISAVSRLSAER